MVSDMPDETDKSTGHGMDCIAYGLVDKYGYVERRRREPKRGKRRVPRKGEGYWGLGIRDWVIGG